MQTSESFYNWSRRWCSSRSPISGPNMTRIVWHIRSSDSFVLTFATGWMCCTIPHRYDAWLHSHHIGVNVISGNVGCHFSLATICWKPNDGARTNKSIQGDLQRFSLEPLHHRLSHNVASPRKVPERIKFCVSLCSFLVHCSLEYCIGNDRASTIWL